MTDEPDDLDTLMASINERIGLGEPIPAADLDKIIAYQRKMRALREQGVKTRKPKSEPTPSVSISALLDQIPKPKPGASGMKRRF